jgi:acetyl esterase
MTPLSIRAKAVVVRGIFALPKPVRRRLAGPPLRIDGQEMDLDAQLAIRLKNGSGSDVFAGPVEMARARYDGLPRIISYKPPLPVATREVSIPAEHGVIPATLYTPAEVPEPSGLLTTVVASRSAHE